MQEDDNNSETFVEYDEDGDRIIGATNLTQQEKQHFQRARVQHKMNMTKVQKIGTKVFKGAAFIGKPQKIQFKDFNVGKPHFLVLTLTNVSNAFNSFNVLPLPQKIRNYFEVTYTPKGKISPGISCDIKFKFMPQINEDINSQFSILAQTGQINFPIICTSKKAIVKCKQPLVNFGKVIEGEVGQAQIKLFNQGALHTNIMIKTEDNMNLNKADEFTRQLLKQVKFTAQSSIQGYSQKTLTFSFEPADVGDFTLNLQLYFQNFTYSPPIIICLKGQCINVPVTIEKPIYDFEICLLNHIYRQKLCLQNSGDIPMSFKVTQPQATKKLFQFNPIIGYIQKHSKIDIWVKFSANKDLSVYLAQYMKQDNIYEIPFEVNIKQQVLPVNFILKFKISKDQLIINPSQLNFGCIFEGLSSKIQVTFQNQSDLPQQVLFYPLKKQIYVENDQSLFKILPKSTIKKCLTYKSKPLQDYKKSFRDEGSIPCKIITGDIAVSQIKIQYICETIKPDLSISYNHIDFKTTQVDQVSYASTIFKNNINKQLIFQLFVPPYEICGLKVTPVVRILNPNQQLQINLEFHSFMKKLTPTLLRQMEAKKNKVKIEQKPPQPQPPKQTKKETKKEGKLSKAQQEALEAQKKRLEQQERLRIQKQKQELQQQQKNFKMQKQLAKFGGTFIDFGQAQHYKWVLPVYFKKKDYPDASVEVNFIEITTTSTQKILVAQQSQIDFGQIAVGARKTQQFIIKNLGQSEMLNKKQLPVFGCFSVLNSLRRIQNNGTFKAIVEFQPTQNQRFQQKLTIYTATSSISCILKGTGVRPDINISPQSGLLHFGGVLEGQYAQKTFKIQNICNFEVEFVLKKIGGGALNSNDSNPVMYIPSSGKVPPNGQIEVKVCFKPDRINQNFYEKIKVHVPQQKNQRYLFISGYCYPRQAYVKHYVQSKLPTNQEVKGRVEYSLDWFRAKDDDAYFGASNKQIVLQFAKIDDKVKQQNEECYKKKLTVGSCKLLDSKSQKPTNFQFILPKDDRFQCDNMKGTTAPGTQTTITFTYKPEPIDPLIENIPVLMGVGQWKDIKVQLKLSGGFVKPGATDAISLDVILRVYVNQI